MKTFISLLAFLVTVPVVAQEPVRLTSDNTLVIADVFDDQVVAQISYEAHKMDSKIPSNDPIYLVINSPGGSIDAGLELINNLSTLHRPVHTLSVFAASMGFQTVQGLGDRLVLSTGTLMSHKARGSIMGEFPGQFDSRYEHELKRVINMDKKVVSRTKGKYNLSSYQALIVPEYWCDGQECVTAGFADKVVSASCDKSLAGVHTKVLLQDILGGMPLEIIGLYDNCPVNTGVLQVTIFLNKEQFFMDGDNLRVALKLVGGREVDKNVNDLSLLTSSLTGSPLSRLTPEQLLDLKAKVADTIKKAKFSNKDHVIKGY